MSQNEARYSARSLIAVFVITIIGTVVALESTGRIAHSENKGDAPVGEFKAIHLAPDNDYRMSYKPSELHAVCIQDYLAIASDVDPSFRAILVDYKNRGVRCGAIHTQIAPTTPEAAPNHE
ncbi:kinase [Marinobacter xestospongiae]|uniref:kinase n=1 Tax=Marinobacter xestospongiae TaxID=994319 RepID=UPI0020053720|nr:kinase [Marinobacter xestospongiae]MCK7568563.1 kinase [Marinobacter xestospongiae]